MGRRSELWRLAFIGIGLICGAVALPLYAQDKGKADFIHNAEFRLRDVFEQNESGSTTSKTNDPATTSNPAHHNGIDQRFKLGMGFRANEKFAAAATLLQSASWGQGPSETLGDRGTTTGGGSGDEKNFLSVNEAYATWMMAEDLNWKIGRMNFAFGDGSVMSTNDYQAQPNSFDGIVANYEAEFGRFTAFAFKYRDLSGPQGNNIPNANVTTSDPQHDAYGLVFDLKTMPEWLKMANAHVIQDSADSYSGQAGSTVATLQAKNATRYGALLAMNFGTLDVKAQYNGVYGKNTDYTGPGNLAAEDRSIQEFMYQAEVGLNLPDLMGSRFYVIYHVDSGTSTVDKATRDRTYDPYFYDRHFSAGQMELVGWGNLTDVSGGWTFKPGDATDVGLAYHLFKKTNSEDNVTAGTYGQNLFKTVVPATASTASQSKIGEEIDLWAEHRYEGGLSILARAGYFIPGGALRDDSIGKRDPVSQFMVQGKLVF